MGASGLTTNPTNQISQIQSLPGAQNILNAGGLGGMNPNITSQSEANLQNSPEAQSTLADISGYAMSDADFAQRYPQMVAAQKAYQGNVNNILGGQQAQATSTGNTLMNQGTALGGTANTLLNEGQQFLGQGSNIINQGQALTSQAQPLINEGQQFGAQAQTAGAADKTLGQNLVSGNQPINPLVQQALMQSGLQSSATALGGAAGLGGPAGQAAVGTQLGVGASNWINQQQQQGMALQGAGEGLQNTAVNAASALTGAGANIANAGSTQTNAGANVGGLGVSTTGAGSTLFNTGANLASTGQNIISNADTNSNAAMGLASSIFQPRQFGISGADAANISLANTAGQNNMNQFLYQTLVNQAQTNNQIAGANASAQSQASGNAISGGAGVASSAAAVGVAFALSCHLAQCVYGRLNPKFYRFRFWLMNCSPNIVKRGYLRYAKSFALYIIDKPVWKRAVMAIMDLILESVPACHFYS